MNYNPGHIDLSGLPRAIDFEAQVARNREIIKALPEHTQEEYDELKIVAELAAATLGGDETYEDLLELCEAHFGNIL